MRFEENLGKYGGAIMIIIIIIINPRARMRSEGLL